MVYYADFIPENIANVGAKRIGIYNEKGNRVGFIPLGNLTIPNGNKLYSFGALSDVHVQYDTAQEDFQRALKYLNDMEGAAFICIAGDLTTSGTAAELEQYKSYVEEYSSKVPIYAIPGNHDARSGLQNSIDQYTGNPRYYTFTHGNDVFIMMGLNADAEGSLFTADQLQWLYEILEENRNKRCFVFEHVNPEDSSGNALGIYKYDIWGGTEAEVFTSLMKHYPNVVLFHGHSHLKFYLQTLSDKANYDHSWGCHSVHIPSLTVPRDTNGAVDPSAVDVYADSEGYVVDVYENGVHLRGRDFVAENFLPIASYWLDTASQTIPAGEYYDDTGTIISTVLKYERSADGTHYICTGVCEGFDDTVVTIDDTLNGLPVLAVGPGAFSTLTGLKKVTFERTPVSIADDAFAGCDNMATVVMPSAPDSDVLDGSPWGSGYVRPRFEIGGVVYRRHSTLTTNRYVIDGITSAFPGGKIEFVDYIGGTRVYELDASSFKGKTTITEVVIPASVLAIEASVFANCTGLTKVTFLGTPSSIPATVFDGCTNLLDIYVPWAEGAKANAPWGATNATIHYGYIE